jgi:hypothetical protein
VRGRLSSILRGVEIRKIDFEPQEKTNQDFYEDSKTNLDDFRRKFDLDIEGYPSTAAVGKPAPKGTRKRAPQRPAAIVLFGKTISIRFAYEILTSVASELIKRRKLSHSNTPVRRGYACFLVNNSPKHPTGDPFKTPKEVGQGLWVEGHCSTQAAIDYAKKLLEHCSCKASDLQIIWK